MTRSAENQEHYRSAIEAKLQPERIRTTLAFTGLYQLVHEMIKHAVLDRLHGFYFMGSDDDQIRKAYEVEVLARAPKNRFKASLLWLVESKAITAEQADRLDAIYDHRHDLTHNLLKYLVDVDHEPSAELFFDALTILTDIEHFWVQIEIDIGTFEEHGEVTVEDVTPGTLGMLQVCVDAYVSGLPSAASEPAS